MIVLLVSSLGVSFDEQKPAEATATALTPQADSAVARGILTADEARGRAEILHEVMHEMLLSVHENYYREDEGLLIPATALNAVFDRIGKKQKIQIRWLAVDAEPMNVGHRPQTDFDHAAVKALKNGQPSYENTVEQTFEYAGPIRLSSECLKCHVPNRTNLRDRLAAIVISMPVTSAGR